MSGFLRGRVGLPTLLPWVTQPTQFLVANYNIVELV